jgi:ribosomal protein S18 acetylase RimI-like enzyme
MEIRPLTIADAERCDEIVASLPDWFGNEQGIQECSLAVRTQPGYASLGASGDIAGFLTVTRPRPSVAEISWVAVHADDRGHGHGRALIEALVADLHRDGTRYLVVKTLSDRDPDAGYAATRAFYVAMGFTPLLDLDLWGPENPALLLVRTIAVPQARDPSPPVGTSSLPLDGSPSGSAPDEPPTNSRAAPRF